MSRGGGLPVSLRVKLSLLIVGPLLVALGFAFGRLAGADSADEIERRGRLLSQTFEGLLEESLRITETALRSSPGDAAKLCAEGSLAQRFEGVGILFHEHGYVDWEGTPAEPPAKFHLPAWPVWTVRVDGVRTRLLVRAGPGEDGRLALGTFIIDTDLEDLRFEQLLPRALRQDSTLAVDFTDTEAHYAQALGTAAGSEPSPAEPDAPPAGARQLQLRAPSGDVLAVARLLPMDPQYRRARLRDAAFAWSATLFVLLLALLFDWRPAAERWHGLLALGAVLAAARALLLLAQAPSLLLPRELGSASAYGSPQLWGLLASPADLLLTAAVLYLFCVAARRTCAALATSRPRSAAVLAGLLAVGATLAAAGLASSLARNSRMPLWDRPAPVFAWDTPLMLWLGLILALLGAAELWAVPALLRVRGHAAARLPVALAFVVLALGSSALLQRLAERLALEQLGSQYAPEILEQSARREVALALAVREAHDRYLHDEAQHGSPTTKPGFLAYRYWAGGELFHSGYKSSLDFYTPDGTEIMDHFGFDLPPLDEKFSAAEETLKVAPEPYAFSPAVRQTLLHAQMPLRRGAELLGFVVGHVLDEPENLSFLPWSQPYLAALGPGSPRDGREEFGGGPQYVLYDAAGSVLLTTLRQPPAYTGALRLDADRGQAIRILAGDSPYIGLALKDDLGRLHLLLNPARGALERLSAAVRLVLLGLLVLAAVALLPRVLRRDGPRGLIDDLRRSFYRKLLVTLLAASALPLLGLSLFLRGYIERRGEAAVTSSATQVVSAAQRVVEDYLAAQPESLENGALLRDPILYWLRYVVGQEIHVYANGLLQASSKRELFTSGLLTPRLDGEVQHGLVRGGLPYLVRYSRLGPNFIPVAYAPVRREQDPAAELVVAVPLVLEQRQIAIAIRRVVEVILLSTVALMGLLAVAAAFLARTVARPVRELVEATGQIAAGRYSARLKPRTRDEVAELVRGFNAMASALAQQREDLERRRDYMEALLQHATTGVISVDPRGRIVTLNPAAGALLAGTNDLRVGVELRQALSGSPELKPLARALDSAIPSRGWPLEVDLQRAGTARRLRLVRVELHDPSGQAFGELILLDDVTDMMRSNQLAAWAEMARAIAHEIKNPLTPIQLSTEHLRRLLRDRHVLPAPELEVCLDTIIKQVRALYEIAGEFSAYAKLPALAPEPTDPIEFMRSAIRPYLAVGPPGVTIEERYEPSPAVSIDRRVLSRAVINLVENALQAMPDGGKLTVAVAHDERDAEVVLSVIDTGVGLTAEVHARLFEPYFSTKSAGTGLGLAIVRRAVEAHDGRIDVESAPRRGTAFHIRLPRSPAA